MLLIALVTLGQKPPYAGKCEVTFHVVNGYGTPLGYAVKNITPNRRTAPDLAGHFAGLHGMNLDPGVYDYELVPGGPPLETIHGTLFLQGPSTWVTHEVWDLAGDFDYLETPGTVRPYHASKEATWLRAMNVYGGQGPERKIQDDGTFMLPLLRGKFIVLVCRGTAILYNGIYEFPRQQKNGPLNIWLNSN